MPGSSMMSRIRWLSLATLLVANGFGTASEARAEATMSAEEIERVVRDYLLREPEIIMEAIQELQRRREVAEATAVRDRIVAERDTLLADLRDPVLGNPNGDVTLVEFFDYRCGYCRAMADPLRGLLSDDTALRVVMKEFPILGPDSLLAARAALAARLQGGYETVHFALMAEPRIDEAAIRRVAGEAGLDVERLFADMGSEAISAHIDDNIRLAQSLGINGTPSFIVGDELVPGAVPMASLTELIAAERGRVQN